MRSAVPDSSRSSTFHFPSWTSVTCTDESPPGIVTFKTASLPKNRTIGRFAVAGNCYGQRAKS